MSNSKLVGLAGLGIGIVFASGCITRGSGSFSEVSPAEPDLSAPYGENPMPAAVAPVQPGNVRYPDPRPAKSPEYWQQHSNPYAGIVQPAAATTPKVSSGSGQGTYIVKKGDILSRIARQYGVKVADIKAANGLTSDTIRVGQKLKIPAKATSAASTRKAAGAAAPGTYIVKKGDILGRIARQHGVKVADLKAANGLTSDTIREGQKLIIPGKAAAAAATAPAKKIETKNEPANSGSAWATTEVQPVVNENIEMPAIPEPPAPQINTAAQEGAATITPAPQQPKRETYTYYANGNEDLLSISISNTMGISEVQRLNPQLSAEYAKPGKKLPAGTPVNLYVK
ncbi:MAG: LysM peptidoglycan-binding domain-containing protein [Kiritimatiellae bacterium]|nr:LysM peptidoglycan-binding domain-containing protein [Kiritimatiellia bacterium]